jgi:hypothetical protein
MSEEKQKLVFQAVIEENAYTELDPKIYERLKIIEIKLEVVQDTLDRLIDKLRSSW